MFGKIISKLAQFFSPETPSEEQQHVPMAEVVFWQIINRCNRRTKTNQLYYVALWEDMTFSEPANIISFQLCLDMLRRELNTWDLWAAFQIVKMLSDSSDFHAFQNWILSHGIEMFQAARSNPNEILETPMTPRCEFFQFAEFDRIPKLAFHDRRNDPRFHQDALPWPELNTSAVQNVLSGEHWEITPSSLKDRYPGFWKLANKEGDSTPVDFTLH